MALFERFPEGFEASPWVLRKLVEKQDSTVSKGDFSGSRSRATTDQTSPRDCVMGSPVWAILD